MPRRILLPLWIRYAETKRTSRRGSAADAGRLPSLTGGGRELVTRFEPPYAENINQSVFGVCVRMLE